MARGGSAGGDSGSPRIIDADFVVINGPLPSATQEHTEPHVSENESVRALPPPPWDAPVLPKNYRHPLERRSNILLQVCLWGSLLGFVVLTSCLDQGTKPPSAQSSQSQKR